MQLNLNNDTQINLHFASKMLLRNRSVSVRLLSQCSRPLGINTICLDGNRCRRLRHFSKRLIQLGRRSQSDVTTKHGDLLVFLNKTVYCFTKKCLTLIQFNISNVKMTSYEGLWTTTSASQKQYNREENVQCFSSSNRNQLKQYT